MSTQAATFPACSHVLIDKDLLGLPFLPARLQIYLRLLRPQAPRSLSTDSQRTSAPSTLRQVSKAVQVLGSRRQQWAKPSWPG
jgi:hypothetical protein